MNAGESIEQISPDEAVKLYREMLRIRRFEEKTAELYSAQKIRGFLHLYIGEEAVATGVMHSVLPDDAVVATYREHGHALCRGISMKQVMAELYGKVVGSSRGRGGSMHIFDAKRRFFGGHAIVGANLPFAIGLALADKLQRKNHVTVCFFGEGAVAEGAFHESMNLAELWELPVLFICENNLYAMGTALKRSESQTNLCEKARSYCIESSAVDGMDVEAVLEASRKALEQVRGGDRPYFLECKTYRFRAHSMFDPDLYREQAEVEEWKTRDPIDSFLKRIRTAGWFEAEAERQVHAEIEEELRLAVEYAEAAEWEAVEDLTRDVYTASPHNKQV